MKITKSHLKEIIKEEIENNKLNEATFTKRHYIAIANILKSSKNVKEVAQQLADMFEEDNSLFKKDFFLKAAGQ